MPIPYLCALRHSNTHCLIYYDCFDQKKCNKSCPQFISSKHICKQNQEKIKITIERGLGSTVLGWLHIPYDEGGETIQIDFCPFCGERLSYDVSALRLAREQFMSKFK